MAGRIGIRGLGLLGSRIAHYVNAASDMELSVGVAIPDNALDALLVRAALHKETRHALPKAMYLAVPRHIGKEAEFVRAYNAKQNIVTFQGASQLCWRKQCDCIVDTAYPAGKRDSVVEQYATFPGPLIVQDGAYPEGVLIAPPVTPLDISASRQATLYRMSDCILSGVVPLIYAFRNHAERIDLHMLTQYNGREPDYLIAERAGAVYIRDDIRQKVRDDLSHLFPAIDIAVPAIVQIPSLLHYQGTLVVKLSSSLTRSEALSLLTSMPRITVLPSGISSTYEVNLARSLFDSLLPVLVFADSVEIQDTADGVVARIVFVLYYRTVAVLANLDAIRMVSGANCSSDPLDVMRRTDREAGF